MSVNVPGDGNLLHIINALKYYGLIDSGSFDRGASLYYVHIVFVRNLHTSFCINSPYITRNVFSHVTSC